MREHVNGMGCPASIDILNHPSQVDHSGNVKHEEIGIIRHDIAVLSVGILRNVTIIYSFVITLPVAIKTATEELHIGVAIIYSILHCVSGNQWGRQIRDIMRFWVVLQDGQQLLVSLTLFLMTVCLFICFIRILDSIHKDSHNHHMAGLDCI